MGKDRREKGRGTGGGEGNGFLRTLHYLGVSVVA
jgi:hypothetical protein